MKLIADKPCPVHQRLAFWVGSDLFCSICFSQMEEQDRQVLFRFWAALILTEVGWFVTEYRELLTNADKE